MVAHDDGGFAARQGVARDDDAGAAGALEEELDPGPAGPGDGVAGEAVGGRGREGPHEEVQEGEEEVLEEEGQGPGGDEEDPAEVVVELGEDRGSHGGRDGFPRGGGWIEGEVGESARR